MIVTTYTCDRCGHQQTTSEQMWRMKIGMYYEDGNPYSSSRYPSKEQDALWCRECVEKIGWLASVSGVVQAEKPKKPSFEELLRMIIRDEITGSQESR